MGDSLWQEPQAHCIELKFEEVDLEHSQPISQYCGKGNPAVAAGQAYVEAQLGCESGIFG